jgi:hypothetical protein
METPDYQSISTDQLLQEQGDILLSCAMWADCNDGSFGLALSNTKYAEVTAEIKRRITSEIR